MNWYIVQAYSGFEKKVVETIKDELKIRTKKDTTIQIRKITLIESLNINSSYNIFADSFNFSNISLNIRTKLFNKINISYSSVFDPYIMGENSRIHKLELFENHRIARFKNSNLSAGVNINDKTFSQKEGNKNEEKRNKIEAKRIQIEQQK